MAPTRPHPQRRDAPMNGRSGRLKAGVLAMTGLVSCAAFCLLSVAPGTAYSRPPPKGAHARQGSGILIVISRAFVDEFADRATMKTKFAVHSVSNVHPAQSDGEVHIAGVAEEARLPTVAELTNPEDVAVKFFRDTAAKKSASDRTLNLEGAWRI